MGRGGQFYRDLHAIKDFLETKRKGLFEPLYFFNLLYKQVHGLQAQMEKPFDYLEHLNMLPLSDAQKYTLKGMLLYWHGGYPINNRNPLYDTILKLIEKEFLASFEGSLTPEKEFCATPVETAKLLKQAGAITSAVLKRQHHFTESRYIDKVSVDFEDLPDWVIQKGIVWRFEEEHFRKDSDYIGWQQKLEDFLLTVPQAHRLKVIEKGIEYGQKAYAYHQGNECSDPKNCVLNQSWERRLALAGAILEKNQPPPVFNAPPEPYLPDNKNKDFTTARQVLAIHFLLKQVGINSVDSPTATAKFIQFLTGREINARRIQDTTIYKTVVQPFKLNDEALLKDLIFIKRYFDEMGLQPVSDAIGKEISACEK